MDKINQPEHRNYLKLLLSGFAMGAADVVPGVSGGTVAFILVLLGKYHYLLESLVSGNWIPLIIVAAGAALGLVSFARLLRWLFSRSHDLTVAVLIGFIIGALPKVWPWKETAQAASASGMEGDLLLEINRLPPSFNTEVALAVGLMALGFIIVIILEWVGQQRAPVMQQ